ncbi:MAG: AI-2E family transporter [Kofleriaceae bacterium]
MSEDRTAALAPWLTWLFAAGAVIVLAPFTPWVVLGVWLALVARRFYEPMLRKFGGRKGLAATVTVSLLLVVAIPIAALTAQVVIETVAFVQQLLDTQQGRSVLERLATGSGGGGGGSQPSLQSLPDIVDLLMREGRGAWTIVTQVAGSVAHVVIGLLIMVTGMYGVLVQGSEWYRWLEHHAPMTPTSFRRLADAFVETGRGLAFGIVGAGLAQSIVAAIAYVVLGVPNALVLGMLTLLFSVIPAIGTAIVWVPVAIGLALSGQTAAAIALAVVGLAVISTIDNLVRPWLARRGQLQLPTYVVLIAMFGAIELIGAWGLLLGPLVVRLAKEALAIRSNHTIQV